MKSFWSGYESRGVRFVTDGKSGAWNLEREEIRRAIFKRVGLGMEMFGM